MNWRGLKARVAHAFSTASERADLTPEDGRILDKLARAVVARGMTEPAVLFLESSRPLNFLGSQALAFFQPFATALFDPARYERLTGILEDRRSVGWLIDRIEKLASQAKSPPRHPDTKKQV